jgi:arylformamidase
VTANFAIALLLFFVVAAINPAVTRSATPEKSAAKVIKDIPYADAAKGDRRRSFDLYLPANLNPKPPLLIFVHGGFWMLSDDEYLIGPHIAETLTRDGVAVALARYRLAPAARHPAQAEDVAAAVASLHRSAERYGYDSKRIFLAGHSAGGHLASLVALDSSYLRRYGFGPDILAGVVSLSGIYDLMPSWPVSQEQLTATTKAFEGSAAALKKAAPVHHVRSNAPAFLILTAENDFPGFAVDAKQFFDALSRAGHKRVKRWIVPERDHFTLTRLDERGSEGRILLLDFLLGVPLPEEFKILVEAKRRWADPPFSTLAFWRHAKSIRSYQVDQRFVNLMMVVYRDLGYEFQECSMNKYHAIELSSYLNLLPAAKVGRGEFLITTNIRKEKQFWKRAEVETYRPVIVVGLDDEKNLFKLGVFYRAFREYSWKTGAPPPLMARPLGAFLHFLKEPPPEIALQAAQFALTEDSFRLVTNDPLAGLSDLPKELYRVLTVRNGCVYCHSLRGLGSRSHHIVAATGNAYGGEALPLEAYPPQVWHTFIFDQLNVAKKIGASPNVVQESVRQPLFELVNRSRQEQANRPPK